MPSPSQEDPNGAADSRSQARTDRHAEGDSGGNVGGVGPVSASGFAESPRQTDGEKEV